MTTGTTSEYTVTMPRKDGDCYRWILICSNFRRNRVLCDKKLGNYIFVAFFQNKNTNEQYNDRQRSRFTYGFPSSYADQLAIIARAVYMLVSVDFQGDTVEGQRVKQKATCDLNCRTDVPE